MNGNGEINKLFAIEIDLKFESYTYIFFFVSSSSISLLVLLLYYYATDGLNNKNY